MRLCWFPLFAQTIGMGRGLQNKDRNRCWNAIIMRRKGTLDPVERRSLPRSSLNDIVPGPGPNVQPLDPLCIPPRSRSPCFLDRSASKSVRLVCKRAVAPSLRAEVRRRKTQHLADRRPFSSTRRSDRSLTVHHVVSFRLASKNRQHRVNFFLDDPTSCKGSHRVATNAMLDGAV